MVLIKQLDFEQKTIFKGSFVIFNLIGVLIISSSLFTTNTLTALNSKGIEVFQIGAWRICSIFHHDDHPFKELKPFTCNFYHTKSFNQTICNLKIEIFALTLIVVITQIRVASLLVITLSIIATLFSLFPLIYVKFNYHLPIVSQLLISTHLFFVTLFRLPYHCHSLQFAELQCVENLFPLPQVWIWVLWIMGFSHHFQFRCISSDLLYTRFYVQTSLSRRLLISLFHLFSLCFHYF